MLPSKEDPVSLLDSTASSCVHSAKETDRNVRTKQAWEERLGPGHRYSKKTFFEQINKILELDMMSNLGHNTDKEKAALTSKSWPGPRSKASVFPLHKTRFTALHCDEATLTVLPQDKNETMPYSCLNTDNNMNVIHNK